MEIKRITDKDSKDETYVAIYDGDQYKYLLSVFPSEDNDNDRNILVMEDIDKEFTYKDLVNVSLNKADILETLEYVCKYEDHLPTFLYHDENYSQEYVDRIETLAAKEIIETAISVGYLPEPEHNKK